MCKQIQLPVRRALPGERAWVPDVDSRDLTEEEMEFGPVTGLPDGIHVVTARQNTPMELYNAAFLLNLAPGDELPELESGFVPTKNGCDSALAIVDHRVVGGVIFFQRERQCYLTLRLDNEAEGVRDVGSRPTVAFIWVHPAYRRRGIARQLLEAVAGHFGCTVSNLGHWLPITPPARELLMKMGIEEVVGIRRP